MDFGWTLQRSWPLGVTAQSRREDAVIVVQLCWEVIWQWLQRFSSTGRLVFQLEVLQESLGPFSQRFLELLRCSWERQRFLWRGFIWWIFGGGALASRFLGFVRRVEYS